MAYLRGEYTVILPAWYRLVYLPVMRDLLLQGHPFDQESFVAMTKRATDQAQITSRDAS